MTSETKQKARNKDSQNVVITTLKETANILFIFVYAIYSYINLLFRFFVPASKKSLDGEIFLITGAGSGIGKEVARNLAQNHPKTVLVLWDVNADQNNATAEETRKLGSKVYSYTVNVADPKQVRDAAKKVQEQVGDVTILFNNAGIAASGLFLDEKTTEENLEKTVQVNLISHFYTLRQFLPKMVELNHGHIVTTGSLGSFFGHKLCTPYYATKFAIRGYIESIEDELRSHPSNPDKIRFTTVFPGFVETAMTANVRTGVGIGKKKGFMQADFVAQKIIDGIREEQEHVFIPKIAEFGVLGKSLMPKRLFLKIRSYFLTDNRKK